MIPSRVRAAQGAVTSVTRCPEGRQLIGIRGLLEWAFGVEWASLEHDEVGRIGPDGFGHRSATANICDMLALGDPSEDPGRGVKVDTFGGRSYPHDDADLIASLVVRSLRWDEAVQVAECARAQAVPQWDLGPTQCLPRGWAKPNQHGRRAQTETLQPSTYRSRGILRRCKPVHCPVHFAPDASQIAAARRAYSQWVINLLHLREVMKAQRFQKFTMIDALPAQRPWKKTL
ncbi:MAG: hypothetical protein AAFN94_00785 [Pseudomonadota bacterium]